MKKVVSLLKRRSSRNYLLIALLITGVSIAAMAYAGSLPHTFTSGTTAKSGEVNDNFSYLLQRSWELSGSDLYYNAGNVGIGTTSPGLNRRLHVYRSDSTDTLVQIEQGDSVGDPKLLFQTAEQNWELGVDNSDSDKFRLTAGTYSTGTNILTATTSGNIGIGTTNPLYELHIHDADAANAAIHLSHSSSGTTIDDGGALFMGITDFIMNNYENGAIKFRTNGTTDNMVIDNSGNVGIGTTSPQGTLDVNGTIYQRGSQIHADYVFEPNYKLESIEDHEEFMWKEKHLKSVPKAKKDENGRDIVEYGSHMKGMLEELEKAHVYVSQLNKIINKQQKTIDVQQQTIDMLSEKVNALMEQK